MTVKLWHLYIAICIELCMIMAGRIVEIFICTGHESSQLSL